jgi:hypothetical protein
MKKILFILMAIFAFGFQNVSAQDTPLKIVTGHPDLKVKIKRCAASGKTIILDLIVTNEGARDVERFALLGSPAWDRGEAYDDEGNIYRESNGGKILLKVTNGTSFESHTSDFRLLSGVPMRVSIKIENFSTSATTIAYLKLGVDCEELGLGDHNKSITFRNIPISRD